MSAALGYLLKERLIDVFVQLGPSGELSKLGTDALLTDILADHRIWNPESALAILIGATELGANHYYGPER